MRSLVALAVADVLLLVAASVGAVAVGRGDPFVGRVAAQPWPGRVTPTGPWSASLEGAGPRFTMTAMAGAIPDALPEATFRLPERTAITSRTTNLTLPDGTIWHPKGAFRLEAAGPLAFTSVRARGDVVDVGVVSLPSVLSGATGPVTAVGTFVGPDGQRTDRLALPPSTYVGEDCGYANCSAPKDPPLVSLTRQPGASIKARAGTAPGEAAVAGSARASALDRSWDGLVGAVEGTELTASATWDGQTWSLSASTTAARQVWMDVWPVADTTLSASSEFNPGRDNCFRDCPVRVRWTNSGWATSQIMEAEGVGSGSGSVGFGLIPSAGHDAGLGVERGGTKRHLGGGGDISSTQQPRQKVDRGLTTRSGTEVVLVLRGNFPEVRVQLATR